MVSPIEGVLSFFKPIKYGTRFVKGELIGTVKNNKIKDNFLYELFTEKQTLETRVAYMEERIRKFTALHNSLENSFKNFQKYSIRKLEAVQAQEQHHLNSEKAELERAKKEFDANKFMSDRAALNKRELEKSEVNYIQAKELVSQITARLAEIANEIDSIRDGSFIGESHNDLPYSKQRMDQLVIEMSLATTTMAEAKNRITGIDYQIAKEQERIKRDSLFNIIAPFDCLIWRIPQIEGNSVIINNELFTILDYSSIFLEVVVSETEFANIKFNEQVRYRLIGDNISHLHIGRVLSLLGSGTNMTDYNLAANIRKDPRREFRVWIEPTHNDKDVNAANFYQVGRRVEVKFTREWHILNF